MPAFWITFAAKRSGCIVAPTEADARTRAEDLMPPSEIESIKVLPYPASPRLDDGAGGPNFCFRPHECAGRTSCPQRTSCAD
jgi:hypothetical protein